MNKCVNRKRSASAPFQPSRKKSRAIHVNRKKQVKKTPRNPANGHAIRRDVNYTSPLPAIRRQLMILDRIGFLIFGVSIVAQIVVSVAACACSEALGLGWTFFFGVLGFVQCLIATFAMVAIRSARINIESEFNAIRKQFNSGRKK